MNIYTCEGGFAVGYLHPVICARTALAWALQLHPVTHTYTYNHTHVHEQKRILPLVRTFARINRGFLMPLAVVRVWNWSAGSQIWQPGPGVWDAPHFRPVSRHYLQIKTFNSRVLQIQKQSFFTSENVFYFLCCSHLSFVYISRHVVITKQAELISLVEVLCLFKKNVFMTFYRVYHNKRCSLVIIAPEHQYCFHVGDVKKLSKSFQRFLRKQIHAGAFFHWCYI